mmetsp:Transcript_78469/g.233773  ORF Transcript_78469/g.233773 Transcript_78469/m.233773 type:complete len:250 (+) Transcript_78469:982-1731(+)
MDPFEELVELCHCLLLQWRYIAARHNGVFQTRVFRKALGHHGLACARGAVEHCVLQRHPPALSRARGIRQPHDLLVQSRMEHHVIELCSVGRAQTQQPQRPDPGLLYRPSPVGHPHERGSAKAFVQLLAEQYRHLSHEVHTADGDDHGPDGKGKVLRGAVHRSNPVEDNVCCRLDGCKRLLPLLLHLHPHRADVHILVLPGRLNFRCLLHLGLLDRLLHTHLRTPLIRLQAQEQQLLFALPLVLLLPHV